MLHELLNKIGFYITKRQYMLRGIDWLWDLQRLNIGDRVPIIFDVGANDGQTTHKILHCFPSATVHAFEPLEKTFDVFSKRFGAKNNVKCNKFAVSDTCGSMSMAVLPYSQMSHIIKDPKSGSENGEVVETVQTTTIDSYCEKNGIRHIDILKTDTEGHDFSVLRGAEKAFRSGQIDWVLVEVTFDPLDETHSQFDAVQTYLKEHGMVVYCFYDHYFLPGKLSHFFCNALFIRKAMSVGQK